MTKYTVVNSGYVYIFHPIFSAWFTSNSTSKLVKNKECIWFFDIDEDVEHKLEFSNNLP